MFASYICVTVSSFVLQHLPVVAKYQENKENLCFFTLPRKKCFFAAELIR